MASVSWSVLVGIISVKFNIEEQVHKPPSWIYTPLVKYFGKLMKIEGYSEYQLLQKQRKKLFAKNNQTPMLMKENSDHSLPGDEKLASTMWSVLILANDHFCMLVYFLVFCGIMLWLFLSLSRHGEQYEKYYGKIEKSAELYDCHRGPQLDNNLSSPGTKEILFCEYKNVE